VFAIVPAILSLNDNLLSGAIPDEITVLNNLESLTIGNNDLTGALPKNVCRIKNLGVISVDCQAQGCDCCTECADELATEPPSEGTATTAPTECADSVTSLFQCYQPGDDVVLNLSNCNPENDDWVGIYDASANFELLANPPVWSWACGSRDCREAVTTQEMALNEAHASTNAWPLIEGTYVLVMARNSAQPYTAYAVSPEFTIQNSC
jgi:hypothetical protein